MQETCHAFTLVANGSRSQDITPTILGTVYVVVNDHGETITRTSTNPGVESLTHYYDNGTLSLLTRTDVNDAGTVTAAINLGSSSTLTL